MAIKTGKDLAAACIDVAKNYKTLYVKGCFGAPMTAPNKRRWIELEHYSYNNKENRKRMIEAASYDTFGFDCVCFIKALLWGWKGDVDHIYGGVTYQSNGVLDMTTDEMIAACKDVTTDFSEIQPGEVVYMKDHIGVYIGDGLVAECSPKWENKVQITACENIGKKEGYNGRTWISHGKLPYVSYEAEKKTVAIDLPVLKKGAKGDDVKALQALLIGYGYKFENNGKVYGIDGSFGTATLNTVKKYQADNGLTPDGSVGRKTWTKLLGV